MSYLNEQLAQHIRRAIFQMDSLDAKTATELKGLIDGKTTDFKKVSGKPNSKPSNSELD